MSDTEQKREDVNIPSISVIKNNEPFESEEAAKAFLVAFTRHKIGQIVEVIYRMDNATTNDPVGALVAIGTKNWYECGPEGKEDPDRWKNTYYPLDKYPNGPNGEEFFDIISCGCKEGATMFTTTITINGVPFDVLNNNKRNEATTDPFEWEQLQNDVPEPEGSDPNIPVKSDTGNTKISLNSTDFHVASKDDQTVSDVFDWQNEEAGINNDNDVFGEFELPEDTNTQSIFEI